MIKVFFQISLLLFSVLPVSAYAKQCVSLVLSGGVSRPFWASVINGAIDAGNQLGYEIHARGTINDNDYDGQRHILNFFTSQYQCVGVVIAPSNKKINSYITKLKQSNIPTVYIDRDSGGDRIATVKTDNFEAGRLAAQKMSEALGGKGNVVLFRLQKGVASTDAREAGFLDEAPKRGLTVIADPYIGTRVGEARNNTRATLLEFNNIDGIFTPNDTTTIGTLFSIESLEQHKNTVHIGFDSTPFIKKSVKEGKLEGFITQSPYQMGYQSIYAIDKAVAGKLRVEKITTPVNYISK